jgi:putative ABC transport system permease protein
VRTAIAYPGASRGRTGMTIAMFSLIVFSLVTISTMNTNYTALFLGDEAAAGWDVRADATNSNPISDFEPVLTAQGIDTSGFTATGMVTTPNPWAARIRQAGDGEWKAFEVRGMNASYIENSEIEFAQRAEGYESDEAIVQALLTEPNVVVIDATAFGSAGIGMEGENLFELTAITADDETFAPVSIEILDPETGEPATVKLIGVIDTNISSMMGLYGNLSTIDTIYPEPIMTSYYISLADDSQSEAVAKQIESALLMNGVQATSIIEELEEGQQQSAGFLHIVEGFMGLGLIVGIAAVGVIAFRSVVERRQQIGVLRAIGFQTSMVSRSFLIETGFIVGMGVISGTALALILARNLMAAEEGAPAFIVPWLTITVILSATVVVALLMAWVPSRQAARIAPAEALRYE